jgi:Tol biopolymer transport system component
MKSLKKIIQTSIVTIPLLFMGYQSMANEGDKAPLRAYTLKTTEVNFKDLMAEKGTIKDMVQLQDGSFLIEYGKGKNTYIYHFSSELEKGINYTAQNPGPDGSIVSHPKGNGFFYCSEQANAQGKKSQSIWFIDTRENQAKQITDVLNAQCPTISPDGKYLSFVGEAESLDVFLLDLESGEEKNITNTPDIDESKAKFDHNKIGYIVEEDANGFCRLQFYDIDKDTTITVEHASEFKDLVIEEVFFNKEGNKILYKTDFSGILYQDLDDAFYKKAEKSRKGTVLPNSKHNKYSMISVDDNGQYFAFVAKTSSGNKVIIIDAENKKNIALSLEGKVDYSSKPINLSADGSTLYSTILDNVFASSSNKKHKSLRLNDFSMKNPLYQKE